MTNWTQVDVDNYYRRLATDGRQSMTKRELSAIPISEADFARAFDELATLRGWTWCGFRTARQKVAGVEQYRTPVIGQKGFPDRVLARNGVVLLVELKRKKGKLSEGQEIWASALNGFTGYHVFRPSDWESIIKILE